MQTIIIRLDAESEISYSPHFLLENSAAQYYAQLEKTLDWQQEKITIFGKTHWQPRLLAWYGDEGASYRYSGIVHKPLLWTADLWALKTMVENFSGVKFNSVLVNNYRHGQDSMGWHSDDEPELGPTPIIASLSLGAARRFCLRPRKGIVGQKQALLLENGSLLLMQGKMQARWQHSIPKTQKQVGPRINLTFRYVQLLHS